MKYHKTGPKEEIASEPPSSKYNLIYELGNWVSKGWDWFQKSKAPEQSAQKSNDNIHTNHERDSSNIESLTDNSETTMEDLAPASERYEQTWVKTNIAKNNRNAKIRKNETKRDKSILEAREAYQNNIQMARQ